MNTLDTNKTSKNSENNKSSDFDTIIRDKLVTLSENIREPTYSKNQLHFTLEDFKRADKTMT